MSGDELFWERVRKRGDDDCWEWQGARTGGRDGDTYGTYARSRKLSGRRNVYAHRMAYCLTHNIDPGFFPSSVVVRHRCDNPICCNPKHLEPGTQTDNVQDKVDRGRTLRGSQIVQSILTEKEVREIKERLVQGDKHRLIADAFGVSRPCITKISQGHTWSWITL